MVQKIVEVVPGIDGTATIFVLMSGISCVTLLKHCTYIVHGPCNKGQNTKAFCHGVGNTNGTKIVQKVRNL